MNEDYDIRRISETSKQDIKNEKIHSLESFEV